MELILTFFTFLAFIALVLIFNTQSKILKELKSIRISGQRKLEIPQIEIPPVKEYSLDLNPVTKAINEVILEVKTLHEYIKTVKKNSEESKPVESPKTDINAELLQNVANTQSDLVKILQETAVLMRVNEAEFQSGLEAFHKAIDKLLAQIPNSEKELSAQKEFMQKFEDAMRIAQEAAAEAMGENSLRLQEILTEVLAKEVK